MITEFVNFLFMSSPVGEMYQSIEQNGCEFWSLRM